MVRRNLRSDFVGGAYVFPGGAVDPLDGGAEAEALCAGRTDAGASTLLGFESGGLAYWVAVVRGTLEEAGILLARRESSPDLLASDQEVERFAAERAAVNTGSRRFLDLCREENLRLTVGDIHYFAHWITPVVPPGATTRGSSSPRHPRGRSPRTTPVRPSPTCGSRRRTRWPTPRRRDRDHLPDHPQPPGHRTLRHQRCAPGRGGAGVDAVPAIEPRVVPDGNGMRIVLLGDPGYERGAVPDPTDGAARGDFNEAVRAVSMRANEEGPDAAPGPRPAGPPPDGP